MEMRATWVTMPKSRVLGGNVCNLKTPGFQPGGAWSLAMSKKIGNSYNRKSFGAIADHILPGGDPPFSKHECKPACQ